jgi:hypothetical protein
MEMNELLALAEKSGLNKKAFSKPKYFYAWLYRILIAEMIRDLCGNEYEIQNSEYTLNRNGKIRELTIILELQIDKIQDVGVYLAKNTELIPWELRQKHDMCIGHYDDENGGIVIDKNSIKLISQSEFCSGYSDGSLTDEVKDQKAYSRTSKLRSAIRKLLKETR